MVDFHAESASRTSQFGLSPTMRFRELLAELPPPGFGEGLHPKLLGVANRARIIGLPALDAVCQIFNAIKPGRREVSLREVEDAVDKAYDQRTTAGWRQSKSTDSPGQPVGSSRRCALMEGGELLRLKFIEKGADFRSEYAWSVASRVGIANSALEQTMDFLRFLYKPDDILFVGERNMGGADCLRSVAQIRAELEKTRVPIPGPLLIANPLTGRIGRTKSGKPSWRADDCVNSFRYAIAEFDNLPLIEDQLAFWAGTGLPIAALVHTGGKSIHAWIPVACANADEWTEWVENSLYANFLVPMGVDPSCRNEARMTRLPGVLRDNGRWQRLLFLDPIATPIGGEMENLSVMTD